MSAANYTKRRMRTGERDVENAGQLTRKLKDSDQPDTVGMILGLPDYQTKLAKTKVELQ